MGESSPAAFELRDREGEDRTYWAVKAFFGALAVAIATAIGLLLVAHGVAGPEVDNVEIAVGSVLVGLVAGASLFAVLVAIRRLVWPPPPRSPAERPRGKVEL